VKKAQNASLTQTKLAMTRAVMEKRLAIVTNTSVTLAPVKISTQQKHRANEMQTDQMAPVTARLS